MVLFRRLRGFIVFFLDSAILRIYVQYKWLAENKRAVAEIDTQMWFKKVDSQKCNCWIEKYATWKKGILPSFMLRPIQQFMLHFYGSTFLNHARILCTSEWRWKHVTSTVGSSSLSFSKDQECFFLYITFAYLHLFKQKFKSINSNKDLRKHTIQWYVFMLYCYFNELYFNIIFYV